MPVICAAIGCNNKFVKGLDIRFYRFPLIKPELATKRVHSLGMKNFTPTANTCLCYKYAAQNYVCFWSKVTPLPLGGFINKSKLNTCCKCAEITD